MVEHWSSMLKDLDFIPSTENNKQTKRKRMIGQWNIISALSANTTTNITMRKLENLKFKVIKTVTECNLWKLLCDEKKRNKQNTRKRKPFPDWERLTREENSKCKPWYWIILNLTPLWLRFRWSLSGNLG